MIGAWRVNWSLVTRKSWEPPAPFRITGHRDRSPSSLERYHPVDLGQFFIDKETLSSTYPDFGSICGDLFCGNTCCVPTDEWDVTYEKMKKWTNESRIPQWVLDKAVAAAGD